MSNFKTLPWLRQTNARHVNQGDCIIAIDSWGQAVEAGLRSKKLPAEPADCVAWVDCLAWKWSGLRCHAVDICETLDRDRLLLALAALAAIARNIRDQSKSAEAVAQLEAVLAGGSFALTWLSTPDTEHPLRGHLLAWRNWSGINITLLPSRLRMPEKISSRHPSDRIFEQATQSQRLAIEELVSLMRVKKAGVRYGGIRPRTNALLVGLSGSGKTWVSQAAAYSVGVPFYSVTVGSWAIQGGRSEVSSSELLRRHLDENGASVIFIDEIDKLRSNRSDNVNFVSFVWDEVMAILDGRVESWPNWSAEDAKALRGSMILGGGAFQDLYRKHLGPDVMFDQQIQDLEPLTFERVVAAGYLPDELLNRMGTVIEVRPPGVTELSAKMEAIEADAGISVTPDQRSKAARRMATSVTGLRGLELYALDLAKKVVCVTEG